MAAHSSRVAAVAVVVSAALLVLPGRAAATITCAAGYSVFPGTGSTIISRVRAHQVTCAQARPAIVRVEGHLRRLRHVRIAGLLYRCARRQIGPLYNGQSDVRCVHGVRFVGWHAGYGI
ncbi:MAG: hypothetical protein LC713_01250 [Actinobacteria bacterium]|nr:hypothetical protein [Actinomycetota bacterium]